MARSRSSWASPPVIGVDAPQVDRVGRHPVHNFHIRHAPYVIQPFCIAPVLPGETVKNISVQARVLTQPIVNPLIGWWIEHYFFYVKHRDMADTALFQQMVLTYGTALTTAADWHAAGSSNKWSGIRNATYVGMDWVTAAMKPIIETFFRDEGRAWNSATIDGFPAAYIEGNTFFDSIMLHTERDTEVDVTIPVDATPNPDVVSYQDILNAQRQYEILRSQGLTNATYEDFLRSYGVRSIAAVQNKPELVRYSREWSYPSSHVQPNAATPALSDVTSAVSWSIAERADKARYIPEPGFIVGCSVCRPKSYTGRQVAPAVSLLNDALGWLPAILRDDVNASWMKYTDSSADIFGGAMTGDFWLDRKDLYLYGDQFLTGDDQQTGFNNQPYPTSAGKADSNEPVQAGVDALFASADATDGVRQDGTVRFHILSAIGPDTSPRGSVSG